MLLVVLMASCKKDLTPGESPMNTSSDLLNQKSGTAINISSKFTTPANGDISVPLDQIITVNFNDKITPAQIAKASFKLYKTTSVDENDESIGTKSIAGTLSFTNSTATFKPAENLTPNTVYKATITTKYFEKDSISRKKKGYTWHFTTGAGLNLSAPSVTLSDPLNSATGVAFNKVVSVTFNNAMNPLTINASTFILKQGLMTVSGTVAYSGTRATFTPSTPLLAGTIYTATISIGAKDLAGNALAANTVWSFTTLSASSTLSIVNLGAAGNYVILAKTAITNIATSAVTGDMGLSPAATSYITGFALTNATGYATASQVTGKVYAADMAVPTPINLTTAVSNMMTAYTDAAGRPTPDFTELGTGNIGGKTLTPGLYKWTTTVTMPSNVTISGGANDVWIFQISKNLIMSSAVKIILTGGAQAKNIFWQVAGQATLGTTSHFEGIILSMTGITFQTGASLNGRALAQSAVILDKNIVTKP